METVNMKKISVIIPAYNAEKYVGRCVNSVLEQDYEGMEIIVVNDGSTDGTDRVLSEFGDRIRYIKKEKNGGVSAARNSALEAASGDYVLFVDSDDSIPRGAVKKYLEIAESFKPDIIRGNYDMVYPSGETKPQLNPFAEERLIRKKDFAKYVYSHFAYGIRYNTTCAALVKRSLIKHRFRTDMKTGEDAVFMMDVYTNAESAFISTDVFYNYFQTGNGLTSARLGVWEKYRCNFEISKEIVKRLPLWGMNTPAWRMRAWLRPVGLTFDKIKRILLR